MKLHEVPTVDHAAALLARASAMNASDLHLDPEGGGLQVRVRVDGRFVDLPAHHGEEAERLIGRLKVLAGLMVYRCDVPQEGRLQMADGREARLAVIPTVNGEKATIRLFSKSGEFTTIASLGLAAEHAQWLANALGRDSGLVLVVGPSGSGKTTTLYASLNEILAERRETCQVCTIEDPVERHVRGATQVEVDRSRNLDFASGLKFLLRQDPEVVMVGEIRDAETARVAVRAAMTGHLVLSTMHCGRACEGRPRLLEMGVPRYAVDIGLLGVLAQRLLRCTCPACGGTGCDACLQTGCRGRSVISEVVDRGTVEPSPTIADVARMLVTRGMVSRGEAERALGGAR